MSVTIEDIEIYEQVKKTATDLGLTLEILHASKAFSVNPPGVEGLILFKDIEDIDNFLYGYRLGKNYGR